MQNLELDIIQFLDEINKDTLKIIKLGNMLPNLIRNFLIDKFVSGIFLEQHIYEEEIKKFGVVSENIAFLMAKNSKELFKTSLSLATTGNVGPLSSDNRSKVGEIYICLIFQEKVFHKKLNLKSTRVENINKLVFEAFSLIDSVL